MGLGWLIRFIAIRGEINLNYDEQTAWTRSMPSVAILSLELEISRGFLQSPAHFSG